MIRRKSDKGILSVSEYDLLAIKDRKNTDPVLASEDAREGAIAFTERRAPVWQGR